MTNHGLTEEDTRDRDRWQNLVLGEGMMMMMTMMKGTFVPEFHTSKAKQSRYTPLWRFGGEEI
jgi:hypothetical protein